MVFKRECKPFLIVSIVASTLLAFVAIVAAWNCGKASEPEVQWDTYSSHNANISFDYPHGWSVTDNVFTSSPAVDAKQTFTYINLWVCPTGSQLMAGPKEGLNNCITLYAATRIFHPVASFSDEGTLFNNFTSYIGSPGYDGLRIMEESNDSKAESSNDVNLIALYIQDQTNPVGMSQLLCANSQTMSCIAQFKHVLDSIQPLSKTN